MRESIKHFAIMPVRFCESTFQFSSWNFHMMIEEFLYSQAFQGTGLNYALMLSCFIANIKITTKSLIKLQVECLIGGHALLAGALKWSSTVYSNHFSITDESEIQEINPPKTVEWKKIWWGMKVFINIFSLIRAFLEFHSQ